MFFQIQILLLLLLQLSSASVMDSSYGVLVSEDQTKNVTNSRIYVPHGVFNINLHFHHVLRTRCASSNNITNEFLLGCHQRSFNFRRYDVVDQPERLSSVFECVGMPSDYVDEAISKVSSYAVNLMRDPNNLERKVFTLTVKVWHTTLINEEDQYRLTGSRGTSKQAIEKLERTQIQGLEWGEEKCMVCLGEFSSDEDGSEIALKLPCGHHFHDDCLVKWLENRNTCPLCRYVMRDAVFIREL